jgi:uncharacterized pyridoxal phosphate-containing UPF0001 family protein
MTITEQASIAENLAEVRERIAAAAREAGRDVAEITLVAVGKTHPAERIEAGVQEAAAKFPALKERHPQLMLHLIGPLQTNKARLAVGLFDVIETIDRPKLARPTAWSPWPATSWACRWSA